MHKLSRLGLRTLSWSWAQKDFFGRYVCGALAMYPYPETLIIEVVTMVFFAKYCPKNIMPFFRLKDFHSPDFWYQDFCSWTFDPTRTFVPLTFVPKGTFAPRTFVSKRTFVQRWTFHPKLSFPRLLFPRLLFPVILFPGGLLLPRGLLFTEDFCSP